MRMYMTLLSNLISITQILPWASCFHVMVKLWAKAVSEWHTLLRTPKPMRWMESSLRWGSGGSNLMLLSFNTPRGTVTSTASPAVSILTSSQSSKAAAKNALLVMIASALLVLC